jgi:hypothetical protein
MEADISYRMLSSNQSIFYDIGSGYGKICWHAALQYQVRSIGSEINAGRHEFASKMAVKYLERRIPTLPFEMLDQLLHFVFEDVVKTSEQLASPFTDPLNPSLHCSHIYSFNTVFEREQLYLIAQRLNLTQFKMLSWTQSPIKTREYGVRDVVYIGRTVIKMSGGSSESFSQYYYIKIPTNDR